MTQTRECWAINPDSGSGRASGREHRPLQAEQPPNEMNRGVERPKERGKEKEEEAEGDLICLKRRLLAQATSVVQTELSGGREA